MAWTTVQLGTFQGERMALRLPVRSSTEQVPPDAVLRLGARSLRLGDALPGGLARLEPHGFAHASQDEWLPFVVRATLLGLL